MSMKIAAYGDHTGQAARAGPQKHDHPCFYFAKLRIHDQLAGRLSRTPHLTSATRCCLLASTTDFVQVEGRCTDNVVLPLAAVIIAVNAAFVMCCLNIIWTRLCSPRRGDPAASAAPAAADDPAPGVAGGGPGAEDDSARRPHIGMTAVVQPNDEVWPPFFLGDISLMVYILPHTYESGLLHCHDLVWLFSRLLVSIKISPSCSISGRT